MNFCLLLLDEGSKKKKERNVTNIQQRQKTGKGFACCSTGGFAEPRAPTGFRQTGSPCLHLSGVRFNAERKRKYNLQALLLSLKKNHEKMRLKIDA